jgi:hypothetical protein
MNHFEECGFEIIDNFFSTEQVNSILQQIDKIYDGRSAFRKSNALYAIRQFLNEVPAVYPLIFIKKFQRLLEEKAGSGYNLVKSIYFDKPAQSNWFVSYHQDLTISVKDKGDFPGFGAWTAKPGQYSVQPPLDILEENVTIRIHLDNTTAENGALRVIPGSHRKGIVRFESKDFDKYEKEIACPVTHGGLMFMKPLLLHSSGSTVNNAQRRVIHVEFSRAKLPDGMVWSERVSWGN